MLSKGDNAPDITLKNQHGKPVALRAFKGKYPMVVYFYPKDETPGCIREACRFRDNFSEFETLGARVFGVSGDSVISHQRFAGRLNLGFDLLSDPERAAEKAFGVPRNLFGILPGRVTFVIDRNGIIRHVYDSALNAAKHATEALNALKSMKG